MLLQAIDMQKSFGGVKALRNEVGVASYPSSSTIFSNDLELAPWEQPFHPGRFSLVATGNRCK
jgi:hypothetical protein